MTYDFNPRPRPRSRPTFHFQLPFVLRPGLNARAIFWVTIATLLILFGTALLIFASVSSWSSQGSTPMGIVVFEPHAELEVRKHVRILWIDFAGKVIRYLELPDEAKISTARYGTYPLSSIYDLFHLEDKPSEELIAFLSLQLRAPIQDFVVRSTKLQEAISIRSLGTELLFRAKTSLSVFERIQVGLFFLTTHFPVQQTNVTKTSDSALPSSYFDYATRYLTNPSIRSEHRTVAIINASGIAAAARTMADILAHYGYIPVVVTDSDKRLEQGKLFSSFSSESYESVFLSTLTHMKLEENKGETQQFRADYVIYIGIDLASLITP